MEALVLTLLLVTIAIGVYLTQYTARRRDAPGALALTALMIAATEWAFGYVLELAAADLAGKVLWAKVEYLGIVAVAPAWFLFAIRYTDRLSWFSRGWRNTAALAVIPAITLILVWTNEAHGLIWSQTALGASGPFLVLKVSYGFWFWIHSAYSYLLLLVGSVWLTVMLTRWARPFRLQAIVALIGALAPWIGNVMFLARLGPLPDLDLTPFAFVVAGAAYAWCLFRLRLLDLVPIARRAVVDGMADCVFVLDLNDRIVDLNPAARRLLGVGDEAVGGSIGERLRSGSALVERARALGAAQAEITMQAGSDRQHYDAHIIPLKNRLRKDVGRLLVLHNITGRKRFEDTLRSQNEYLSALHDTTLGLIDRLDQTSLLDAIVARAAALVGTDHAFLYVVEPGGTEMILRVARGVFADAIGSVLRRGDAPGGQPSNQLAPPAVDESAEWSKQISELSRLPTVTCLPLRVGPEVIGAIGLAYTEAGRAFTPEQVAVLARFGQLASLALQNARLYAAAQTELRERRRFEARLRQANDELEQRVTDRTAALRQANQDLERELARRERAETELHNLAQRLDAAREADRALVARRVHDELGQMLTALKMDVVWLSKRLPEQDVPLQHKAAAMLDVIGATIRSVQDISSELRPGLLDKLGLVAAIEWQAREFQERTEIACHLDADDEALFDVRRDLATALFRIVQESLTNVARHAEATEVCISLTRRGDQLGLIVQDNGKGIAPLHISSATSLGLIGMRERLHPWNGELIIEGQSGAGTTISVRVPLEGV